MSLQRTSAMLHILLVLAEGERHGYAIIREVSELSGGAVRMGPGTLYGALNRMLEAGFIEECAHKPDPALGSERRRYYSLTRSGRFVAEAEAERLAHIVRASRLELFHQEA